MLGDVNDDFGFGHCSSLTGKYRLVNTDDVEIKPKKEYVEKQIAALEEELKRTQTLKEIALRRYTDEERKILDKITAKRKELKEL